MSPITTHILDTTSGTPASGVMVTLSRRAVDGTWVRIAEGMTNEDGRVPGLLPDGTILENGTYQLNFATGEYFARNMTDHFYPFVEVVFTVKDQRHHHVPLLLNPFGYSTYRGS